MAGLIKKIASYGGLGGAAGAYASNKSFRKGVNSFLGGTPDQIQQISNLRPDQEALSNQLVQAGKEKGAGGAFGDVADYYRGNLSDNPADFNAFAAPALRQYNQDIMPGIAEQFAGYGSSGSGSLSSSGFQNAQVQGATDLSERLGALRANLRQNSASGLANIGQLGLQSFQTNRDVPGTPGFLSQIAPAAGAVAGTIFGGPAGGAAGYQAGNMFSNMFGSGANRVGSNSSPYGNTQGRASPQLGTQTVPNFGR